MKEETFAQKCTKENIARKDIQVGSGKNEGAWGQKERVVDLKQRTSSLPVQTPALFTTTTTTICKEEASNKRLGDWVIWTNHPSDNKWYTKYTNYLTASKN